MDEDKFTTVELDDTDKNLEAVATGIRYAIKNQYDLPDGCTIYPYGIDASVPDERFVTHVYIEDSEGNEVTDLEE
jgi:hypothetical protein